MRFRGRGGFRGRGRGGFRGKRNEGGNSSFRGGNKRFKPNDEPTNNENSADESFPSDDSSDNSSDNEEVQENPISHLLGTFDVKPSSSEEEQNEDEEIGSEENEQSDLEDMNSDVDGEESAAENGDDGDSDGDAEEASNQESEEDDSVDEDMESDAEENSSHKDSDPFSLHFERNLGKANGEQVLNLSQWVPSFLNWENLGRIKVESPHIKAEKKKFLLLDDTEDSALPEVGPRLEILAPELDACFIKKQLQQNFSKLTINNEENGERLSDYLQREILSIICRYSDFYYPESTHDKWEKIRQIYSLHALNHVLKTRNNIVAHNTKLNRKKDEANCSIYKDQGFTRPKVLILLPFKNSAYKVVNTLIALMFGDTKNPDIQNKKRFEEDFTSSASVSENPSKPEDYNRLFEGDISEDFKMGVSVTKKSLKLYSEFYRSDIIIASPLGLRYTVGTKGEEDYDADFLSSIEILILDQADIFLMQNWEHILVIMESLNNLPCDIQNLNTNLDRIRYWSLDGLAPQYRQTLMFSSTMVDYNRAQFLKGTNFAGRAQVLNMVDKGTIGEVIVPSELLIRKIAGTDADARFKFFTQKFLPEWRISHDGHTLIFVPDYCDYVRLVRFMKDDKGSSISTINEYMVGEHNKLAKARGMFFEGKRQFMILTERFHFYQRSKIKGVQHVIFYDLPTFPHFFPEICNWMVRTLQNPRESLIVRHQIAIIYQECNARVVGVLGAKRTANLEASKKPVHMCTIGS